MKFVSMLCIFPVHSTVFSEKNYVQVSSVRVSKSDDKRLSIFSGTKTLHLRCISREDRAEWIESLLAAKDKFPRLSVGDLAPSEEMVISTEKLRSRLSQEGITEEIIKDCESIMLGELTTLQNQMKTLQLKHVVLLDTLRQLEVQIRILFSHCKSPKEFELHFLTRSYYAIIISL